MEQILVQQIDVGSESKPVIAGTSVSVKQIDNITRWGSGDENT